MEKRVGLVLNPETPVSRITHVLPYLDQVLIMTVNPGFYGSPFLPKMLKKVTALRTHYPTLDIEVDGGIPPETISMVYTAGANLFVSGSYIVKASDVRKSIENLNKQLSDEQ